MILAPSLLACDFLNIQNEIEKIKNHKNLWLHLDVMDGHFVPNLSFGKVVFEKIGRISNYPLDAHLMVTNPEFYIEDYKNIGLHNFTFHLEASDDCLSLIKEAKKYYPSVGISIKPNTDINQLSYDILQNIDLILIMSVEPGFGGQSFMPEALLKVQSLIQKKKEKNYSYQIQIDGGINLETAKLAIQAGVDNLVAGSFIFNNQDPNNIIKKIFELG